MPWVNAVRSAEYGQRKEIESGEDVRRRGEEEDDDDDDGARSIGKVSEMTVKKKEIFEF